METIYIDRAFSKGLRGVRIILKAPNRVVIKYALKLSFKAINNAT